MATLHLYDNAIDAFTDLLHDPSAPRQLLSDVRSSLLKIRPKILAAGLPLSARLREEYVKNFLKTNAPRSAYNNAVAALSIRPYTATYFSTPSYHSCTLTQRFGSEFYSATGQSTTPALAEDIAIPRLINQIPVPLPTDRPPHVPRSPVDRDPLTARISLFDAAISAARALAPIPTAPTQALTNLASALEFARPKPAPRPSDPTPASFVSLFEAALDAGSCISDAYASVVSSLALRNFTPFTSVYGGVSYTTVIQFFGTWYFTATGLGRTDRESLDLGLLALVDRFKGKPVETPGPSASPMTIDELTTALNGLTTRPPPSN
jgi:hypothetical protein